MSTPARRPNTAAIQTLKILVGSVVGALFLMAVALSFVLGFGAPPLWAVVVLLALGVLAHLVMESRGYRAAPVPLSLDRDAARAAGMAAFRSTLVMRLAISESVAFIGLVLAFAAGKTVLIYDVGAAVTVLLMALHVWPSLRTVDRVVANLEKDGADTGLRELLGFGGPGGPIQRAS